MTLPSNAALRERAHGLANVAMYTIALQCRRVRTVEPEDDVFVFRWWADLQFLIVALRRLRRVTEIAARLPDASTGLHSAIRDFDAALPALSKMRNVGEHIEEYAADRSERHYKDVDRRQLEVGGWGGTTYTWLQHSLNIDEARLAAERLYDSIRNEAHRA